MVATNRLSIAAIFAVRIRLGRARPAAAGSVIGISSGQGAWRALVMIRTQTNPNAGVAIGIAMTRAGRGRTDRLVGIGEIDANDIPALGGHLLQVCIVLGIFRGQPFREGGERVLQRIVSTDRVGGCFGQDYLIQLAEAGAIPPPRPLLQVAR